MPRMLVIVIAMIIMLAGGAVTVVQQMELGPFASKVTTEEDADGKKKEALKSIEPPRFIAMEPLLIPLFQGDNVAATVQIKIQIETTADREPQLNKQLPRLKDAYIRDLHSYVPRLLKEKKDLNINSLKRRLTIIGSRTVGEGLIGGILIQSAMNRKLP